ncbi:hypothetical protein ABZ023_27380 [Streptomyces sp. NPDC006367]|uniref:hypothetical protein n=1 Tax=unclassified Streptomyces TaxID=2593676 RepID=UPI0033B834BB
MDTTRAALDAVAHQNIAQTWTPAPAPAPAVQNALARGPVVPPPAMPGTGTRV